MGENMLRVLREMMENARKNGYPEAAKALSTVIGDLQRVDKDYISRKQLLAYIKSSFKAITKTKEQAAKVGIEYSADPEFVKVLNDIEDEFAPEQLTQAELFVYFEDLVRFNPGINKGMMLKALKQEFPDQYDGKEAALIADGVLSKI